MRHIHLATATAVGLALAACAGGEEQAAADEEAAEATEGAAGEGDADTGAAAEDGALFVDESGFIESAIAQEMAARLADYRQETGRTVAVVAIMSTEGADIAAEAERMRTERGADALILVAGGDKDIGIAGVNQATAESAEESMTNALDNGMIREAFDMGIGLVTDSLDQQ